MWDLNAEEVITVILMKPVLGRYQKEVFDVFEDYIVNNFYSGMIEWKHLQLSSEDYENFINNQDQELMIINDLNITEWQQLYHEVQLRSLNNKDIKTKILSYENNLKRITSDNLLKGNRKELLRQYYQYHNELKIRLSQLYSQIDLLHLKNISTSVELIISRLLAIEEDLINTISQNECTAERLRHQLEEAELGKKQNVCSECMEHMEKTKYKYLKNLIMAGEEFSGGRDQAKQSQAQRVKKYMREDLKNEQNEYQIRRIHYLYDLEQALRNRDKTMQCSSTPLQTVLEDYLHHMLQILQSKKINFAPKNIGEYGRVSQSYEALEEMKKLFNHKDFKNNITQLLRQPFATFDHRLKAIILSTLNRTSISSKDSAVQTNYLREFQLIGNLEKQVQRLTVELESIRTSKNKMENDLISNMETFHKYELKSLQLNNKNKQLAAELIKAQTQVQSFRKQMEMSHNFQKEERDNLIETNLREKNSLLHELRKLEGQLKRIKGEKNGWQGRIVQRVQREMQTDVVEKQPHRLAISLGEGNKQTKKGKLKLLRSQKRISIQVEQKLKWKANDLLKFETEQEVARNKIKSKSRSRKLNEQQRPSHESRAILSRENLSKRSRPKIEKDTPLIKINTVNPSVPLAQAQYKQNIPEVTHPHYSHFRAESSVLIGENYHNRRIKKLSSAIRGHGYHKSDFVWHQNEGVSPMESRGDLGPASPNASMRILSMKKVQTTAEYFGEQGQGRQGKGKTSPFGSMKQHQQLDRQLQVSRLELNFDKEAGQLRAKKSQMLTIEQHQCMDQTRQILKRVDLHPLEQPDLILLQKFISFCVLHFKALQKKDAFHLVYNLKPNLGELTKKQFAQQIDYNERDPSYQPFKNIHLNHPKIRKAKMDLFFSLQEAKRYQDQLGLWQEIDHCIMLDNTFNNHCENIEAFFEKMKTSRPSLYRECVLFLKKPCRNLEIKGQGQPCKQESGDSQEYSPGQIKKIFKKLLQIHQLIHKRCRHVNIFLQQLGF